MAKRKVYTREFKTEAVRLVLERGVSRAQAARDLGIHISVLRGWLQSYQRDPSQAFPGVGKQAPEAAEVTQLRREVTRLKMERDILKKAAAFFAQESM
jgi:transposase